MSHPVWDVVLAFAEANGWVDPGEALRLELKDRRQIHDEPDKTSGAPLLLRALVRGGLRRDAVPVAARLVLVLEEEIANG